MGLDIVAFRQIAPAPDAALIDGYPVDYENHIVFWKNPDFPDRFGDLQEGLAYTWREQWGFRAGSYSGYNGWRDQLAQMAGYPLGARPDFFSKQDQATQADFTRYNWTFGAWDQQGGPFWELINFSDCDGTLCAAVARRLLQDFAAYTDKAQAVGGDFAELYALWHKACAMAADDGAIAFR